MHFKTHKSRKRQALSISQLMAPNYTRDMHDIYIYIYVYIHSRHIEDIPLVAHFPFGFYSTEQCK